MRNQNSFLNLNAKCPVHTLNEIKNREPDFSRWEMRNDMIKEAVIECCEFGSLSFGIEYVSGRQGVGYGHVSEGNIGLMILSLANLLGIGHINGDIIAAFKDKPIRVLFKPNFGGSVVESTYIGHFMEDKFIKMSELIMIGLNTER